MKYYTYIYFDPKDNTPIYVGKGNRGRYRKAKKVNALLRQRVAEGYAVEPILIEASTEEEACTNEIHYIALYGRLCNGTGTLYNKFTGGNKRSKEDKEYMRQVNKGRTRSAESIAKQVITQTGRKCSEDTKKKIAAPQIGRPKTEQAKLNMSIAAKKRVRLPMSEETKRKIGEAARNRILGPRSKEAIVKMVATNKANRETKKQCHTTAK
jgi:hypothetical protein